jgi:hypothetical protein
MKSSYSQLMQTQYFHPAFNSAIYDGPLRLYFAQFHESLALKIYFLAHQKLNKIWNEAKDVSRRSGSTVLVLLYPSGDFFDQTFAKAVHFNQRVAIDHFEQDLLLGIRGPLDDEELEPFLKVLEVEMRKWIDSHDSRTNPGLEYQAST